MTTEQLKTKKEKYYIRYRNKGEIDVNAFRLMGASTKEDEEDKIGYFGSGLKYAMAVMLREGIDFKCYSGVKEIKVGTRKTMMRGEEFHVITINGTPTSLTTRMGKDWKTWYAVREIYCNSLDEGGVEVSTAGEPKGSKGHTDIFVEITPAINEIHTNWDNYFSDKRSPITKLKDVKVFHPAVQGELRVYRRNMLVHKENERSLFDYDIHNAEINESRALSSGFNLQWYLASVWAKGATKEMLNVLFGDVGKDSFEWGLHWETFSVSVFSDAWLNAIGKKIVIPAENAGLYIDDLNGEHIILPYELCKKLKEFYKNRIIVRGIDAITDDGVVELESTEREKMTIEQSLEFLKDAGLPVEYPVKMAEIEGLGEAKDGKIYLSQRTVARGKRETVETIVHEWAHLESKKADRTRGYADYLIEVIVNTLQEKNGIIL